MYKFQNIVNAAVVNFHSKCKLLGGVTEFFGKAFLCLFHPRTFLSRLYIRYAPFRYKSRCVTVQKIAYSKGAR